jgi:hypothetical protein
MTSAHFEGLLIVEIEDVKKLGLRIVNWTP